MRVKMIIAHVRIQGEIRIPLKVNFSAHFGDSLTTIAIKIVIMATPTTILVIGLIKESCVKNEKCQEQWMFFSVQGRVQKKAKQGTLSKHKLQRTTPKTKCYITSQDIPRKIFSL